MAGIGKSAIEEVRSWPRRRAFWWLMVLAPLLCVGILSLVLGSGALRKMPVAVCDLDNSPMSRELTRQVEATPSMRIATMVATPKEGEALLRSGQVYAVLLIPHHFERDVLRKRPVRPIAYLEGQHMVTAGVLSRDFTELGLSFWRTQDTKMRENAGIPASAAAMQASTIALDLRPIANPSVNYRIFLLPGLLPALLQLTMTLMTVCSLARLGQTKQQRQSTPWRRAVGTLIPVAVWNWLLGCGMAGGLELHGDLVLQGSFAGLAAAYLAFTLASVALGVLLFGITDTLLQSLSVVSALSSPAFAFAGLTFPLLSMPLPGRLWAALLPLTHLMKITVQCGQEGSPLTAQLPSFTSLGLIFLFSTIIGLPLAAHRIAEECQNFPRPKIGEGPALNTEITLPPPAPLVFRAFSDECHALIHSYSGLIVLVAGVLFYSLLYPLPYHHETPQKLPLLVVDQDRSTTSRTLLRMLDSTEGVQVSAVYTDAPRALADLRDGSGQAALIIPGSFERNLLRGSHSILPVYLDAGYLLPYRVAYKGIKLAVENMGAGVRAQQFEARGMPGRAALALQLRGQIAVGTLYNPSGNYAQSTIPAVFVLILQQTLLIGSAILAGRLYAPQSAHDAGSARYLLGRLLFLTCLYIIHAVYYLWFLPAFYDLPRAGSTGQLLLFLLPFFLACGAAGSAFARLIRKPELVLIAALPCSLPFLFLSGFAWPTEAMPAALRLVAAILPSTPAINGYLLMSQRGASLADVLPLWGQLWGLALLFFGLAWALIKSRKGEKDFRGE